MSLNIQTNVAIPQNNVTFGNKSRLKQLAQDYTRREAKRIDKKTNNWITAHLFKSDIKSAFLEAIAVILDSTKELLSALKLKPKNRIEPFSSNRYIINNK